MNRTLTTKELAQIANAPVNMPARAMTKREKLMRFAAILRGQTAGFFGSAPRVVVFSNIEYMSAAQLNELQHPQSAFALAHQDPELNKAGLTSPTVGAAKKFFELSSDELHAFSCDCGGGISTTDMANRVETIAQRA